MKTNTLEVFHTANRIYSAYWKSGIPVNLRLYENMSISVEMLKSESETPPYHEFTKLPTSLIDSPEICESKLKEYINTLKSLNCSLYTSYAEHLSSTFFQGKGPLITKAAEKFNTILESCHKKSDAELEVRLRLSSPMTLNVTSYLFECNMIYEFASNDLLFTGFPSNVLPGSKSIASLFGASTITGFRPKLNEDVPTHYLLQLPSITRCISLYEEINPFLQTLDDILDKIIQNLVLNDLIDTLQDIVLDEEESSLYLCFDPTLTNEDIQMVLITVKQAHPQALLFAKPTGSDSPWWVVQVSKAEAMAAKIADAPISDVAKLGDTGIVAKPATDPLSSIAQGIDVGRVVMAAGGKG